VSSSQRASQPQTEPGPEPGDATALTPEELEGLRDGLAAIERGETSLREQAAAHLDAHIRAALAAARRR
jgi:predicted DNA-binding transcriptional regulator YafY